MNYTFLLSSCLDSSIEIAVLNEINRSIDVEEVTDWLGFYFSMVIKSNLKIS